LLPQKILTEKERKRRKRGGGEGKIKSQPHRRPSGARLPQSSSSRRGPG